MFCKQSYKRFIKSTYCNFSYIFFLLDVTFKRHNLLLVSVSSSRKASNGSFLQSSSFSLSLLFKIRQKLDFLRKSFFFVIAFILFSE